MDIQTSSVKYSIIIPAYNEADNLRIILPNLSSLLNTHHKGEFEIMVVDTVQGCADTKKVCIKNGVVYLQRAPDNYYGDAVRKGILEANGLWVLFMDADGSHSSTTILELISKTIDDNCDIVVASRYMQGGLSENNSSLVYMSKILNIIYTRLLNIKCLDISNSLKIYRAEFLKKLNLQCKNFDIIEEMMCKLSKRHYKLKIIEIPCLFKKRMHGKSKRKMIIFISSYFATLFRLLGYRYFSKGIN